MYTFLLFRLNSQFYWIHCDRICFCFGFLVFISICSRASWKILTRFLALKDVKWMYMKRKYEKQGPETWEMLEVVTFPILITQNWFYAVVLSNCCDKQTETFLKTTKNRYSCTRIQRKPKHLTFSKTRFSSGFLKSGKLQRIESIPMKWRFDL